MLGLRSMFFAVAGAAQRFAYLEIGLSAVLVFVGLKMALVDVVEVPPMISLAVVASLLGVSICASIFLGKRAIVSRSRANAWRGVEV